MAKDIVSYFLEQGEPIIPKRKPRYSYQLKKLDTQAAKNTFSSETIDYLKRELQDKAYENKEITTSDYYEMIKPESAGPRLEDGRIQFNDGTPKNFNRNPGGKNQYVLRTDAEIQKIINNPKYKDYTRKDFRNEKILTRKETERPGLKFKNFGKKVKVDKRKGQNLKMSEFNKSAQGSSISMDKINNFAHFAPKLKSYLTSTADTGPLKAEVNRAAEGYDKKALSIAEKQEKLITQKPKGWKLKLDAANAEARKASIEANKTLPRDLKGTLGYFVVSPSGEFKLKGVDKAKTFAGISGDRREFKSMNPSERSNYGKTQSVVQNLIDKVKSKFPNVKTTRATNLSLPPKTVTANMFKGAFKGLPGKAGEVKDPLGGPDLIDIKKLDKNPYNDA